MFVHVTNFERYQRLRMSDNMHINVIYLEDKMRNYCNKLSSVVNDSIYTSYEAILL